MNGSGAERRGAEIVRADQIEDLANSDAARGRQSGTTHAIGAVWGANWIALLGAVICQILGGKLAGLPWIALHRFDDIAGDIALVKGFGPVARDDLERIGKGRIGKLVASRPRPSLRIEEIAAGLRREALRASAGEQL